MMRKIVLAIPNREYAAGLAEYLRETEPAWETSAFTHETALRLRLQEPDAIHMLIGHPSLLRQAVPLPKNVMRVAALVDEPGQSQGEWPEIALYQSLPGAAAGIRSLMLESVPDGHEGCRMLTVFSAMGGAGKTTTALNLVRQAGERGWRTLYLNLETLNATSRLFGIGEPDSLSSLLYTLQTDPEGFAEQLARSARHQPFLRADFLDAPEYPGERTAMTPNLLESLVNRIRLSGRYDLVIADPDSGISHWHRMLIGLSGRVAWLVSDDWQSMEKTGRHLAYWQEQWPEWSGKVSFVRNRGQGLLMNRWKLPSAETAVLPYIPQWKGMDEPGKLFGAAAFSGVLDRLLDEWGFDRKRKGERPDGSMGTGRG